MKYVSNKTAITPKVRMMYINVFLASTRKRLPTIESICEAYRSIYVLHVNHTIGNTTFLSSASFTQMIQFATKIQMQNHITILMKYVSNQTIIIPKVHMMFPKNNNSLDQRKVMETDLYQGLGLHTNNLLLRNMALKHYTIPLKMQH